MAVAVVMLACLAHWVARQMETVVRPPRLDFALADQPSFDVSGAANQDAPVLVTGRWSGTCLAGNTGWPDLEVTVELRQAPSGGVGGELVLAAEAWRARGTLQGEAFPYRLGGWSPVVGQRRPLFAHVVEIYANIFPSRLVGILRESANDPMFPAAPKSTSRIWPWHLGAGCTFELRRAQPEGESIVSSI